MGPATTSPANVTRSPAPSTTAGCPRRRRRQGRPSAPVEDPAGDAPARRTVALAGTASRRASIGATRVAAHAGAMAATRVTRSPRPGRHDGPRLDAGEVVGISTPISVKQGADTRRQADPEQQAQPTGERADQGRLEQHPPSTWPRVAPTARSSATSRRRWATRTLKVFQMTNEPTRTEMPANTSSTVVKTPMASRTAAEPSAATWSPVSASTPSGRPPRSGRGARRSSAGLGLDVHLVEHAHLVEQPLGGRRGRTRPWWHQGGCRSRRSR